MARAGMVSRTGGNLQPPRFRRVSFTCILDNSLRVSNLPLHRIALHRIALYCIALHCIALHCIAAAAPSVTRFGLPPPPPPTGPNPNAYPSPHPHTLAARKSFSAALTMSLIFMQLVVSKLQEMLPRKSKVPRFET